MKRGIAKKPIRKLRQNCRRYSNQRKEKKKGWGKNKRWDMQKMNRKIIGLNPTISIITLNVDGLNMPIKDIDYLAKLKKKKTGLMFSIRTAY